MSGGLERRYRRALRLLPRYYRERWEEDMVGAFLDSSLTGSPEDDAFTSEYGKPSLPELVSVAALATRLYLGGPGRYFTQGQAVRNAVLVVTLARATQALGSFAVLAWGRRYFGLPAAPASLTGPAWDGIWAGTWYAVGYAWIVAYVALVLGYRRTAQGIALLALGPDLVYLLRYPGSWAGWILLGLVPVLAMAAFHAEAPPISRRRWLLALPASFAAVAVPVIALQASGHAGWLDRPGLACLLVALGALAHALATREGSAEWSLTVILLATAAGIYQVAALPADPHRLAAGLTELLVLAAAVAVDGHSLIAAWRPLSPPSPARLLLVAGLAAAVALLAAAGRWHAGSTDSGRSPTASQAAAPIVVTAMVSQPQTPAGGCPGGYARVSVPGAADAGLCFRRDGTPATFSSAQVTWNPLDHGYQFVVTVPASEATALRAVTATAAASQGFAGFSVGGKTWELQRVATPLTGERFAVLVPVKQAADELLHLLVPAD